MDDNQVVYWTLLPRVHRSLFKAWHRPIVVCNYSVSDYVKWKDNIG